MKRQGMIVKPKELLELATELITDLLLNNPKGSFKNKEEVLNQDCQIVIINKEGMSDTWRIEK